MAMASRRISGVVVAQCCALIAGARSGETPTAALEGRPLGRDGKGGEHLEVGRQREEDLRGVGAALLARSRAP
eukprot:8405758-Alexandrium_andersonii.AAC.1